MYQNVTAIILALCMTVSAFGGTIALFGAQAPAQQEVSFA